jgi:hypothetical protein
MTVCVSFRRLSGARIVVALDGAQTIASVRAVLESEHGVSPNGRLVFRGRVLSDGATLASLAPKPDEFVIILPLPGAAAGDPADFGARLAGYDADRAVGLLLDPGAPADAAALRSATGLPPEHCERALRAAEYSLQAAAAMLIGGALTDAEMRQVARLQEATGDERAYVIDVFLACNKNEEAAANCLLEGR